jgi:hypothetical protein
MSETTYTVVDRNELTIIIAEACLGISRPANVTATEALLALHHGDPETLKGFQRAADAAVKFIAEATGATVQRLEMSATQQ